MLSLTLNSLRGRQKETNTKNACTGFIETKEYAPISLFLCNMKLFVEAYFHT